VSALQATQLQRRFGKHLAVDGLDLRVAEGEIYGLVGPDGAGKTTSLRMCAGLLTPTDGNVLLCGRDPFHDHSVRELLGYLPQQYSLYGDLTVDENLAFFGELTCLPRADFTERRTRLLGLTRLDRFCDRRADALSGGMYKKLALACALLHRPKVLLLDEPTNGVDPVSRRELWDLLHEFLAEGVAILFATPYMDEAARCHRVGLLRDGRLMEEGRPAELLERFPHEVLRVRGPLDDLLEHHCDVVFFTRLGRDLRVIVRRGRRESLAAELAARGGVPAPALPNFEDLFLSQVRQ
jgi:ABC-2 type transport system ATP-binding protein